MVRVAQPPTSRSLNLFARVAMAAIAAAALVTGALNARPLFDEAVGAIAPGTSSAIDDLTGVEERPASVLDARIASMQESLSGGDSGSTGLVSTMLGQAYLQKARETGDPAYYPKAETLFHQALAADAEDVEAMIGLGALALARHQFTEALVWGERARAIAPVSAQVHGVIGDALIELGRYDEAVATIQTMVDLRPDLRSYSRVSYLRELMGDRDGAIAAMEQAAVAGAGYAENIAWVHVQLGALRFDGGDLAGAARDYAAALAAAPGYAPALAGEGEVAAAEGNLDRAADLYARAVRAAPLPEFLVAYGDVLLAAGRADEAETHYAMVEAIQQLNAEAGVETDLELVLFTADHGDQEDLPRAVEQARAAVAARPSIVAYDVLAWTLYRSGDLDGAAQASEQALRLGTRNALMEFHAGMIAAARGERSAAVAFLEGALSQNPYFSVRHAPVARATLRMLEAGTGEVAW